MLYDDASLEQAAGEFLAAGPHKGTIFTNCATVYPGCTDALAKRAADAGVIFLSVPIFGRPDAILAHKGLLVSAGPEEGRQRVCSSQIRLQLEFLIFSVSLSSSLLVSVRDTDRCRCMRWQTGKLSQDEANGSAIFAQVKPLLDAIGQGILDVGDSAKSGAAMKLVSWKWQAAFSDTALCICVYDANGL